MDYNVKQLITVIEEDDCIKDKAIIVEIGGDQVPLRHVYVVNQDMINEGTYKQKQIGTLVLDLDV